VPYEPAGDAVVGTVDPAPVTQEPTEGPPAVTTTSSMTIDTPVPAVGTVAVAEVSRTRASKRRTRDTGIEPPY